MSTIRTSAFGLLRGQVEGMIADGKSFERLERVIDGARLPADQRDALWLLAWSLERRRGSDSELARPDPRTAERLVLVEGGV